MGTIQELGDVNWQRRVIAVVILFLSLPVVLPALFLAYINWVPPYAATMTISDLQAELTLRFFYTWDEAQGDHGRYLTIRASGGRKTIAMTAFDWAHNSRTSIYRTPDGEIAILGPIGDDYLVSPGTMKVVQRYVADSDQWTYLGAFDYQHFQHGRELRFFRDGEQPECIPMVGLDVYATQARYTARQRSCDSYVAKGKK